MAKLNVSPTRMERTRQRGREKTARRGHKLLKDKSDEMSRQFYIMIKQNRALRELVEEEITRSLRLFMTARVHMTAQEIENALDACTETVRPYHFTVGQRNIMGLTVPKITLVEEEHEIITRSTYLTTHQSFDKSIHALQA